MLYCLLWLRLFSSNLVFFLDWMIKFYLPVMVKSDGQHAFGWRKRWELHMASLVDHWRKQHCRNQLRWKGCHPVQFRLNPKHTCMGTWILWTTHCMVWNFLLPKLLMISRQFESLVAWGSARKIWMKSKKINFSILL